jgi:energy-coupling factor transporter ATP-binding protein EcfA2
MTDKSYYSEIGGDVKGLIGDGEFKGIAGDISGGVINQYIITQKSGVEIQAQTLITGSPYLGLRKFEVDDKDRFFGRDNWIIELTDYLKQKNVLLLLGASGSGKSSLVQAGLIPKLKDDFGANRLVNLTFVPDVNPFESFYGCLLGNRYTQSQAKLAQAVKEDTLIKVVKGLKNNSDLWFIFIDQFEELFTRTPKTETDIFIKSLIKLIEKNDSLVKIVMTMRADFLDKLSPYPSLGKIHDQYSKMLTDMDESELRLAIAEPAARNGVRSERYTLEGHHSTVNSVNFSPDGKTLVSGSGDNTIKLWNVETGKEIRTLKGHDNLVNSVSFSPDGKTLASGSVDKTIKLWNGSNGWDLDALMGRSCAWVRAYLHNPNSGVREEDRALCDGIGGKSS